MKKRKGSAVWKGSIREGSGTVSSESGVLKDVAYSFAKRFEDAPGTNPEELIAAAHASCFSMALSGNLNRAGMTADSIATTATVTLVKEADGFTITDVHLDVEARVPGADRDAFDGAAEAAKSGCPISKVLNANITMSVALES